MSAVDLDLHHLIDCRPITNVLVCGQLKERTMKARVEGLVSYLQAAGAIF
jgi:hypothetical protein